jgi:hypothetical protein
MPANRSNGSSHSHPRSRAAQLLAKFLSEAHEDVELAFISLCDAHPPEVQALTQLHAEHKQRQGESAVFRAARCSEEHLFFADGVRAGDRLGDFRLDARIGSGGQGEVWEAWQVSLQRKVALKLVLPDRINNKTLALFAREARAGGRLAHPGIVAVRTSQQ